MRAQERRRDLIEERREEGMMPSILLLKLVILNKPKYSAFGTTE